MDPEIGVVDILGRDDRRFGFLKVAESLFPLVYTGERVYFRFDHGLPIIAGQGDSRPMFYAGRALCETGPGLRDPRRGDILVFERAFGSPLYKANPWGYHSQWKTAEKEIASQPVYRVLETMNSLGSKPPEPKVLWQGKDIQEALRRFPVPTGRRSPGADPLIPYFGDSDNIFEVRHWWEIQQPDGSWERCNDPRPLTGVLRQFERISRR